MLNNMTTIAGVASGGILAVAVAGLQKIRSFFQYISSFIIVRASLDSMITGTVVIYLKQEFKPIPSTMLTYIGELFTIRKQMKIVPFRIIGDKALFVKGWRIILFDQSSPGGGRLTTIRGMWNLDKFISDALDSSERYRKVESDKDKHTASRFSIIKIIGREKVATFSYDSNKEKAEDAEPAKGQSKGNLIHVGLDKSFKYAEPEYLSYTVADPLEGLYFDDYIVSHFEEANQWLSMRSWYQDKGIPWRKGWLLYGPGRHW